MKITRRHIGAQCTTDFFCRIREICDKNQSRVIILLIVASCLIQTTGRLQGVVRTQTGAPVPNAVVVITNQVTRQIRRVRTNADGSYSIRLPAGAYRVTLDQPHVAAFDKDKNYGDYAIVRGDTLENVIIAPNQNIELEIRCCRKSNRNTNRQRKETPDRWRITFPEYDRYGDRGSAGARYSFQARTLVGSLQPERAQRRLSDQGRQAFHDSHRRELDECRAATRADAVGCQQRRTRSAASSSAGRNSSPPAQTLQFSFELFHGDTTFKPRDWAIKISPTFSVPNYLNARENGVVNIDVRRGTNRTDWHVSLEEAFGEVKLFDVNANYDFVSVRAGIQPFVSDFRGFIFSDNNLGARVFGAADNNRVQFNAAYFSMLEKDTNSGLNRFDTRHQNVYIANIFRQDFIRKGYTIQGSFHYNDDRRSVKFDRNGFLVRPALIGDVRPHAVKVGYLGFSGDGHLGRLNLSHSYYYAFGHDERNPIAGRRVDIRSHMAALEASIDKDYLRFKGSFFWAQGDANPTDDRGNGFRCDLRRSEFRRRPVFILDAKWNSFDANGRWVGPAE